MLAEDDRTSVIRIDHRSFQHLKDLLYFPLFFVTSEKGGRSVNDGPPGLGPQSPPNLRGSAGKARLTANGQKKGTTDWPRCIMEG